MAQATIDPGRFDLDPERSFTLPAAYYWSDEIYRREVDAIFSKSWRFVGHLTEVTDAGDYLTQDICGQSIFVVRGRDGNLRGFHNVCRHRAHQLVSGRKGNLKAVITCPYHAWAYGLDGSLKAARKSETVTGFRSRRLWPIAGRSRDVLRFCFCQPGSRCSATGRTRAGI